jgi:hypothetical protein
VVWCGVVWLVWGGVVWCGVVGVVWGGVVWCGIVKNLKKLDFAYIWT